MRQEVLFIFILVAFCSRAKTEDFPHACLIVRNPFLLFLADTKVTSFFTMLNIFYASDV